MSFNRSFASGRPNDLDTPAPSTMALRRPCLGGRLRAASGFLSNVLLIWRRVEAAAGMVECYTPMTGGTKDELTACCRLESRRWTGFKRPTFERRSQNNSLLNTRCSPTKPTRITGSEEAIPPTGLEHQRCRKRLAEFPNGLVSGGRSLFQTVLPVCLSSGKPTFECGTVRE